MEHPINQIKNLEEVVKQVLFDEVDCRDNDLLLILKIWAYQNPNLRNTTFSFVEFSRGLLNGLYAKPESITRCRRKLQEKYVVLQGKTWVLRHDLEEEVRSEIKNI